MVFIILLIGAIVAFLVGNAVVGWVCLGSLVVLVALMLFYMSVGD